MDKRKCIGDLEPLAEEAARHNEQGTVFKITKRITGKYHTASMLVKDNNCTRGSRKRAGWSTSEKF